MANTFSVDQISTLLKAVLSQATGRTDLTGLDTAQLLTIGQKAIATAPDPVLKSVSQMITRTIFSGRPYKAKFANMRRSEEEWGNCVRKLVIVDTPSDLKDSEYLNLVDGTSIDPWKVDNTKVLELNFVGQQTYSITKTIYKNQFRTCFNSAEEFGSFISLIMTYVSNKIEKIHEETARATVAGAMGGLLSDTANPGRVIHLVTEYKAAIGDSSTINVFDPANFDAFVKWVYSRIEDITANMSEYSSLYQTAMTVGNIDRHTPADKVSAFFYAPFFRQASNRVLADTYHNEMLKLIPNAEMVNFWQSMKTPDSINLKDASYLKADGTIAKSSAAVNKSKIFGLICDREAMGYNPILTDSGVSPYNQRGKYWNYDWTFNERHYVDYTEKMVMLILD